jgi:hypothetical protein
VRVDVERVRDPLAALYPTSAGMLTHDLIDHPLLSLDALADAATRMNPVHVEVRRGDAGPGGHFEHIEDASPASMIRNIADSGAWAMLRFAEQLPEYRALYDSALARFADTIAVQTGVMRDPRVFIFISSGDTVTPFHCDAEYNILFQIAGDKSFRTFPPRAPFLTAEDEERLHVTGDNMLPWNDRYGVHGVDHRLSPGDAVFVPYKVPHLVSVTRGPSVSLSLTWKSDWSLAQDEAHRFNAAMRRIGLRPRDVPGWPARAQAKAMGNKLLRRVGLPR